MRYFTNVYVVEQSASHNVMPIGPGVPPPVPDTPTVRIAANSNSELPTSTLAPPTLANPPAPTNLSSTAIVLAGERGIGMGRTDATGGMPSGIMANVWGSSNWGFVNRLERYVLLKFFRMLRAALRSSLVSDGECHEGSCSSAMSRSLPYTYKGRKREILTLITSIEGS